MKHKKLKMIKMMFLSMMTLLSVFILSINVKAADTDLVVNITKPDEEWLSDEYEITVSVTLNKSDVTIKTVNAKMEAGGTNTNITNTLKYTVTDNGTLYITVKDSEGETYERTYDINYFDKEGPELIGAIDEGVLTMHVSDNQSGVNSLIINGYEYDNCPEGFLEIRLTQFEASIEKFSIYAKDMVGNYSSEYLIDNPYYQTDEEREDSDEDYSAYLPINAENSAITSAVGTVTKHATDYGYTDGVGEVLDVSGNHVLDYDGMEFYVIETNTGKSFYMIIDKSEKSNNAYLLTEASEADLLNFSGTTSKVLPKNAAVIAGTYEGSGDKDEEVVIKANSYNQSPDAVQEGEEVPVKKKSLPSNNLVMVGIITVVFAGIAIVMKKKKKTNDFPEEERLEDDDDELLDEEVEELEEIEEEIPEDLVEE